MSRAKHFISSQLNRFEPEALLVLRQFLFREYFANNNLRSWASLWQSFMDQLKQTNTGTQSVSEPSKRINQSIKHESTDRLIAINRSINESFHRWNKKSINQSINQSTIKLFFMPKSWGYNYHWETLWSRNERQLPTPPWTQKRRQLRSLNFFINNTLVEKKRKEKNQTNKKHPFVPQQSESVYPWLLRKFVYQLRLSEVDSREQPVSSVALGVLSTIQKKSSCDKHPLTIWTQIRVYKLWKSSNLFANGFAHRIRFWFRLFRFVCIQFFL